MECLDANAVQDLMSGALDEVTRKVTVQHLDGCVDCRNLISLLAKEVTRTAALETLDKDRSDESLALRETEAPDGDGKVDVKKLAETVTSAGGGLPINPLAATAEVSLILKSGMRQIGKTFGRYTLVDRIGAGAMGVVYRADDPGLGRRVALKLLHKPDPSLTDRLIREARSMAQVNHPNVVQVYDAGVSDGSTYIAMELVTGSSLRQWQQQKRSVPEIIEMYLAAGRGLAAAHAAGIVHRDFKPDNCLVGGSDGRVRVTDFGLASARPSEDTGLDAGMHELELTHSGMVLGTPAYMAPEQFTGGNVDPRTDQFNYCVALYEALYGQRPFKGKTFDELGDNVCDGKVRPPPAGARASRAVRASVMKGLSVRPGDRYATMDELLDDLGADRARKWRLTSIVSAVLATALGLGIGADFLVRERVSHENTQSFGATGVQIGRAFNLLAERFDTNANQMYHQVGLREVANYRDQADFGLGTEEDDGKERNRIRDALHSIDFSFWHTIVKTRKGDKRTSQKSIIAIADYKGRMLFTEGLGASDRITDLTQIPWLASALAAQREKAMILQPTNDKKLRESQLLGASPQFKLGFFFARTLLTGGGGNADEKERSGTIVQAVDASELVDDIRLDKQIKLSIVSPDGVPDREYSPDGDSVPQPLIDAALEGKGKVVEAEYDGQPYQVQAEPVPDIEDGTSTRATIGHVVMARELGGVLSGFFPGARQVFSIAALIALLLAIATFVQVRRLTR